MDWLMVIAFVVFSIMDSKKKSEQAKQQREQRMKQQKQQVYRSESSSMQEQPKPRMTEAARPKSASQQPKKSGGLLDTFSDWMDDLEKMLDPEDLTGSQKAGQAKPAQQRSAGNYVPNHSKKSKKATATTAKKSPGTLPTKTLMEMRPDREQREEHTRVSASVKPVTASVKPLKNAFENDEKCEHRIELNPNIQYSKQKQQEALQTASIVKTDKDALIQGIIWSEILGKPKAYQPNEPKFRRRA